MEPNLSVSPKDVLVGRGGFCNGHEGNKFYRTVCAKNKQNYAVADKKGKKQIACEVIALIRDRNGRFLQRVDKDKQDSPWVEAHEDVALKKTIQTLREGLKIRSMSSKGKMEGDAQASSKRERETPKSHLRPTIMRQKEKSGVTKPSAEARDPGVPMPQHRASREHLDFASGPSIADSAKEEGNSSPSSKLVDPSSDWRDQAELDKRHTVSRHPFKRTVSFDQTFFTSDKPKHADGEWLEQTAFDFSDDYSVDLSVQEVISQCETKSSAAPVVSGINWGGMDRDGPRRVSTNHTFAREPFLPDEICFGTRHPFDEPLPIDENFIEFSTGEMLF